MELLIHVGINTVNLNGQYYTAHVSEGDTVKTGDLLLTFDMEKIRQAGYDLTTPVIVTNTDDYQEVTALKNGPVQAMEPFIRVN